MWFKQEIRLDDSNFNLENYYSLIDVIHARVQSSTCTTYGECNNERANSEIGYTTDCVYNSFWDRQRVEFCMLYSFVGTIANIYLAEKRLGIANWPIDSKKQYVSARQLPHTKAYI